MIKFDGLVRALSKVGRVLKGAAPEIAIVAGTAGLVTAGVLACKETPKAMKTVEEHKTKMATVEEATKNGVTAAGETYSDEDAKHDKVMIFTQDALQIAKVYWLPTVIAAASIIAIFAGGKIFRGRITTLTSTVAMLDGNFKKYRDGVIEKFGKDIDRELRYKTTDDVIETTVKDSDGNEHKELKDVKKTSYDGYSDYARFFDESNPNWVKDGPRNLMFLEHMQRYANDRLQLRHVLFLNEVYEMLGMPRSPEGQLVGWVYNPDDPMVDCVVDFGISEMIRDKKKFYEIMRDQERSFLLDFNCDGRILEKLTKFERY